MKDKIKLFAVILAFITLMTTMAYCGKSDNKDKNIVGEWLNSNGEIKMVVSSTGFYDDDNYGTGTWKYLDDETIQFTDFDGTIKTTVVEENEDEYTIFDGLYCKKK